MLIDKKVADTFLSNYKTVMAFLNDGSCPGNIQEYASLRPLIFQNIDSLEKEISNIVDQNFISSIKSGVCGKFVYLKKYQKGYILQHIDTNKYYQVAALTTPLEELIGEEYCLISTAIIPYANQLVCDGLVLSHNVIVGKNMAKEIRDGYWQAKKSGELITHA